MAIKGGSLLERHFFSFLPCVALYWSVFISHTPVAIVYFEPSKAVIRQVLRNLPENNSHCSDQAQASAKELLGDPVPSVSYILGLCLEITVKTAEAQWVDRVVSNERQSGYPRWMQNNHLD